MELRLQLLESFMAKGSDGADYKVCAYERLVLVPGSADQWESTGQAEYRLADSRPVEVSQDGSMRIAGAGIELSTHESNEQAHIR